VTQIAINGQSRAQKRSSAFVTTKKGVRYLTVKIGREHFALMRIYNYTIDAQDKRDRSIYQNL
jgi:hypothetical protein